MRCNCTIHLIRADDADDCAYVKVAPSVMKEKNISITHTHTDESCAGRWDGSRAGKRREEM